MGGPILRPLSILTLREGPEAGSVSGEGRELKTQAKQSGTGAERQARREAARRAWLASYYGNAPAIAEVSRQVLRRADLLRRKAAARAARKKAVRARRQVVAEANGRG